MQQHHYLILDGAQIGDLIKTIYRLQPAAEIDILYLNTPFAELQEVSPVLVKITPNNALYQHFQAQWQNTAGIHMIATGDLYSLGNHLRTSLQAKINGQAYFFRFYDPRILSLWLETLTKQQQQQFMGSISKLYLPDPNTGELIEYTNDTPLIAVTVNTPWIELNEAQLHHLNQARKAQTKQRILSDLARFFPEKIQPMSEQQQEQLFNTSYDKAKQYQLDSPRDIYLWSILLLHKGLDFPEAAPHEPYQKLLNDRTQSPEARLDNLIARLQQEQNSPAQQQATKKDLTHE